MALSKSIILQRIKSRNVYKSVQSSRNFFSKEYLKVRVDKYEENKKEFLLKTLHPEKEKNRLQEKFRNLEDKKMFYDDVISLIYLSQTVEDKRTNVGILKAVLANDDKWALEVVNLYFKQCFIDDTTEGVLDLLYDANFKKLKEEKPDQGRIEFTPGIGPGQSWMMVPS